VAVVQKTSQSLSDDTSGNKRNPIKSIRGKSEKDEKHFQLSILNKSAANADLIPSTTLPLDKEMIQDSKKRKLKLTKNVSDKKKCTTESEKRTDSEKICVESTHCHMSDGAKHLSQMSKNNSKTTNIDYEPLIYTSRGTGSLRGVNGIEDIEMVETDPAFLEECKGDDLYVDAQATLKNNEGLVLSDKGRDECAQLISDDEDRAMLIEEEQFILTKDRQDCLNQSINDEDKNEKLRRMGIHALYDAITSKSVEEQKTTAIDQTSSLYAGKLVEKDAPKHSERTRQLVPKLSVTQCDISQLRERKKYATAIGEALNNQSIAESGACTSVTETGACASVAETGVCTSVTETSACASVAVTSAYASVAVTGACASVAEIGASTSDMCTGNSGSKNLFVDSRCVVTNSEANNNVKSWKSAGSFSAPKASKSVVTVPSSSELGETSKLGDQTLSTTRVLTGSSLTKNDSSSSLMNSVFSPVNQVFEDVDSDTTSLDISSKVRFGAKQLTAGREEHYLKDTLNDEDGVDNAVPLAVDTFGTTMSHDHITMRIGSDYLPVKQTNIEVQNQQPSANNRVEAVKFSVRSSQQSLSLRSEKNDNERSEKSTMPRGKIAKPGNKGSKSSVPKFSTSLTGMLISQLSEKSPSEAQKWNISGLKKISSNCDTKGSIDSNQCLKRVANVAALGDTSQYTATEGGGSLSNKALKNGFSNIPDPSDVMSYTRKCSIPLTIVDAPLENTSDITEDIDKSRTTDFIGYKSDRSLCKGSERRTSQVGGEKEKGPNNVAVVQKEVENNSCISKSYDRPQSVGVEPCQRRCVVSTGVTKVSTNLANVTTDMETTGDSVVREVLDVSMNQEMEQNAAEIFPGISGIPTITETRFVKVSVGQNPASNAGDNDSSLKKKYKKMEYQINEGRLKYSKMTQTPPRLAPSLAPGSGYNRSDFMSEHLDIESGQNAIVSMEEPIIGNISNNYSLQEQNKDCAHTDNLYVDPQASIIIHSSNFKGTSKSSTAVRIISDKDDGAPESNFGERQDCKERHSTSEFIRNKKRNNPTTSNLVNINCSSNEYSVEDQTDAHDLITNSSKDRQISNSSKDGQITSTSKDREITNISKDLPVSTASSGALKVFPPVRSSSKVSTAVAGIEGGSFSWSHLLEREAVLNNVGIASRRIVPTKRPAKVSVTEHTIGSPVMNSTRNESLPSFSRRPAKKVSVAEYLANPSNLILFEERNQPVGEMADLCHYNVPILVPDRGDVGRTKHLDDKGLSQDGIEKVTQETNVGIGEGVVKRGESKVSMVDVVVCVNEETNQSQSSLTEASLSETCPDQTSCDPCSSSQGSMKRAC